MTNDKQTAEEAMRERRQALQDRWIITFNNPLGEWCIVENVLEVSEEWAWQVAMKFKGLPRNLTPGQRHRIEVRKAEGYRAVKVKLVEIEG